MSQINLQKIVTVLKMPGLFHLKGYNPKGYFLQPLTGGATRFVGNERGKVLALGNIDLALKEGSINLMEVFQKMASVHDRIPEVRDTEQLRRFFDQLIPGLNHNKVAMSHLVKVMTWYYMISSDFDVAEAVNDEDDGLMIV